MALLGAPTPGRFGVADGAAVCSNAAPSAAGDCTAPGFPPPAPSALADVARSVALSESSILRTRERVRQASVQPSLDGPDSCSRTRLSRSARAADSERIALAARDRRPTPTRCLLRTCPFSSIRSRAGRASHRCCGCRCRTRHQKATAADFTHATPFLPFPRLTAAVLSVAARGLLWPLLGATTQPGDGLPQRDERSMRAVRQQVRRARVRRNESTTSRSSWSLHETVRASSQCPRDTTARRCGDWLVGKLHAATTDGIGGTGAAG